MRERQTVRAEADGVGLEGWVSGDGPPVLLLHGGPGLGYGYLDSLADELGDGFTVAAYQQRGLPPSSTAGPFGVGDHVRDVARFLDALGWDRATVVGHSWGGHLSIHVAVALAERLTGVLAVDPLGAVGDGGQAAFEAEIFRRTPADIREQAEELDRRALAGEGSEQDALTGLRLVWPAYFPNWDTAPPMPPIGLSVQAYAETFASLHDELPALEAALPSIGVPVGFVAGAASPMPVTASTDTAGRIAGAFVEVVEGAGHMPWLDVPGSVARAVARLVPPSR